MSTATLPASANLVNVALVKALSSLADSSTLEPGTYPVDVTCLVHVRGELSKGKDTLYTPTAKIPLLSTLALVLQKSGISRELSSRLLIEAMTEALAAEENADEAISERVKDIEEAMERVRTITKALPKETRAGALRAKIELVTVDLVEDGAVEGIAARQVA